MQTTEIVIGKIKGALQKYATELNCTYQAVAIHIDGSLIEAVDEEGETLFSLRDGKTFVKYLNISDIFSLNMMEKIFVTHEKVYGYINRAVVKFAREYDVDISKIKVIIYADDKEFNPNLYLFVNGTPIKNLEVEDIIQLK